MQTFDPVKMSLKGLALIEASAGTGKTHGITSLYLRLVMERGLLPGKILVVTFTKAATEELRYKIGSRLKEALFFLKGKSSHIEDDFILNLFKALKRKGLTGDILIQRVEEALLRLDEAAIFTIHGFCQRMLSEFVFESGTLFEKKVIKSQEELYRLGFFEYVRKRFYKEEGWLIKKAISLFGEALPQGLFEKAHIYLSLPRPEILPEITLEEVIEEFFAFERDVKELGKALKAHSSKSLKTLETFYQEAIDTFLEPLDEGAGQLSAFYRSSIKKLMVRRLKKGLKKALSAFDSFSPRHDSQMPGLPLLDLSNVASGENLDFLFDAFVSSKSKDLKKIDISTRKELEESLLLKWKESGHSFLKKYNDLILKDSLISGIQRLYFFYQGIEKRLFSALLRDSIAFTLDYVSKEKQKEMLFSYDDMLLNLKDAIYHKRFGKILTHKIRDKFPVALIDEFQDTDSIQWKIFKRIYDDYNKSTLILIGDPKQAIYGFRGADIFTYIRAKKKIPETRLFSLSTNWRSNTELVEIINEIFLNQDENPFVFDGIRYQRVTAQRGEWLFIDGEREEGFEFLIDDVSGNVSANNINEISTERLFCLEIKRLIYLGQQKRAWIYQGDVKKRPLTAGDITVLVRSHYEATIVARELTRLGIPFAYSGKNSVFSSFEARELLYVLNGIFNPLDSKAVSAALCTRLLGVSAKELLELKNDLKGWDRICDKFHELKLIWQKSGVFPMLMTLFKRFNVPEKLLSSRDGERALTNLRHLSELLSKAELEKEGGERLIAWLKENIENPRELEEEHELRLETDENIVNIMTYHKSKGLEFPVVFLPFLDEMNPKPNDYFFCHRCSSYVVETAPKRPEDRDFKRWLTGIFDGAEGRKSQSEHREEQEKEAFSETQRLIYVALTRAKAKCYLALKGGFFNGLLNEQAAFLEGEVKDSEEKLKRYLGKLYGKKGLNAFFKDEKFLDVKSFKEKEITERYSDYLFDVPKIRRLPLAPWSWRRLSYSSIANEALVEDLDSPFLKLDMAKDPHDLRETHSILAFPRGTHAGDLIHKLLETIDFDAERDEIFERAKDLINEYGFDQKWACVLSEHIYNLFGTEILPDLRLKDIEKGNMVKEMDFHMSFNRAEIGRYSRFFDDFEGGVIKGFIDLAFKFGDSYYCLDYKSNWLGPAIEDYSRKNLEMAMDEHDYWLQAAIYVKAFETYLKRIYSKNDKRPLVKGAIYLFLRGAGHKKNDSRYGVLFISRDELKERLKEKLPVL